MQVVLVRVLAPGITMSARKAIVIGGGAAGLLAAGQLAQSGIDTLLLEKKKQPGRKLRITGKGRCNLTNIAPLNDFITHFGKNGRFLRQPFNRFFSSELIAMLGEMGLSIKHERGGRVFPENEDAPAVTEALVQWVRQSGAKISCEDSVSQLLIEDNRVVGVKVGVRTIPAAAIIIATGGLSYPATGSTGDGYKLAASAGHTIIPTRPALIPLVTRGNVAPRLQGLSLRNVLVTAKAEGKKISEGFGEMIFTHYGLSGPIILTLSGEVVDRVILKQKVILSIDLKPALSDQQLDQRLLREFKTDGKKQFHSILRSLLPSKMIPVCCDLTGIPADKAGHHISSDERRILRNWLKDFRFEISGYRPIEEAIVTAGGVETKEIDPRSMASKLIEGLYFAGEVIDINGATGGYNLQAAFSTGWLAGQSAAVFVNNLPD